MRLNIVLNKKHQRLDEFVLSWLLPSISNSLKAKIYKNKLLLRNYENFMPKKALYDNLILAADNLILQHKNNSDDLLITINPNKINKQNTAKLYDLCALVNYGSIGCPALPIFTQTFDYFAKNFWFFFSDYKVGILPCL